MSRNFKRSLPDLPGVRLDDWDLLRRIQGLFDPYRPIRTGHEGYALFSVEDRRGTYSAVNVDELREAIAAQHEEPISIRLFAAGRNAFDKDYELGIELSPTHSRALFYSEDESIVTHMEMRTRELVGSAGTYPAPKERPPTDTTRVDLLTRASTQEPWTRSHRLEVILVILTVVGLAIAWLSYRATQTHSAGRSTATTTPRAPTTTESQGTTPVRTKPMFQPPTGSTCGSLRGLRALQGSPPSLARGDLLVVRLLPHGSYERALRIRAGDTVRFSMELNNGSYAGDDDLVLSAPLRAIPGGCWRVVASAHSTTEPTAHTVAAPVFLVGPRDNHLRLAVVPGSTTLYDEHAQRLARLNDTATSSVAIPFTLTGGTTWFVIFDVRVEPQ